MPDGDLTNTTFKARYRHLFRVLCQGKEDSECRIVAAIALKRDLQDMGDEVARSALAIGDAIERFVNQHLGIDALRINQIVDNVIIQTQCPTRHQELLRAAGRDVVQDYRYGEAQHYADVGALVYKRMALRRFGEQFEDRVADQKLPLYNNANPAEIESRVRSMASSIDHTANSLARQVAAGKPVAKLRRPTIDTGKVQLRTDNLLS